MWAAAIVMGDSSGQDVAQMQLGQRNEEVQALAANGGHQAFAERIRLRSPNWSSEDRQTHPRQRAIYTLRVNAVAISRNSAAIRSSPQVRLAVAIAAISRRRSAGVRGRPSPFDLHRHNNRKAFRCQRISVSGLTITSNCRQSTNRDNTTSVMRVASSTPARLHLPLDIQLQLLAQQQVLRRQLAA
jgi:hypothetical protein